MRNMKKYCAEINIEWFIFMVQIMGIFFIQEWYTQNINK